MFTQNSRWPVIAGLACLAPVAQAHPGHDHSAMIMNSVGLAVLVLLVAAPLLNSLLGQKGKPASKKIFIRNRRD